MNLFTTIFTQPLANGLILFYNIFFENMGLAIIGFSIALLFIMRPLTKPYLDSMKKMRDLAPELSKLKERHKDDKMKFAQAQAELYKQKGVNPGAGCLPYLLQIVILIAFFNVFTHTIKPDQAEMRSKFNELLYPSLQITDDRTINTQFLFVDIAKPDLYPIQGLPFALPGIFLVLAGLVQLFSSVMMLPAVKAEEAVAKKTKDDMDDMQVAMQRSMVYTFPLMTILAGYHLPAGLALYWLTFSLYQIFNNYKTNGLGGLSPWLAKAGIKIGESGIVTNKSTLQSEVIVDKSNQAVDGKKEKNSKTLKLQNSKQGKKKKGKKRR